MRGLVVLVFVIGFCAMIVAQVASHSTAGRPYPSTVASENPEPRKADQVADLKANNPPQFSRDDGSIALDRASDGHFYADVRINGNAVHMLVDTGASGIALSRDDARAAGLATSIGMNDVVGEGADGVVRGEYVTLDRVELGPLSASGLDAVVLNSGGQSLLGQEFLAKFASVEIHGDTMTLK
jgi:aspartyl protease family protein